MPSRKLSFALANMAAVLVALYVAFALDLERPYWAMFTVFIVANPIAGMVRSKAVYRFVGTFIGAAVSLLLVPPLVHAPALLCVAIGLWVGACVYLSLIDRSPRSYTFLLAGYTATLVGLAVVNSPATIFDTAVSRVEEISLGVICAAIAHSVIFPQSVTVQLNREVGATLSAARTWLSESLMYPERPVDPHAQQQLATLVARLPLLATHVAFETSDVPRAGGCISVLQDRLALLLPRVSGVQKAVGALAATSQVPSSVTNALEAASRWLCCEESPEPVSSYPYRSVSSVRAAATAVVSSRATPIEWHGLLEQSALTNLRELIVAFADAKLLASALTKDRPKLPAQLEREAARAALRPLYRDRGLALLSGFAAAGSTLLGCLLWIEGSWPEGAVAAQFAAIGCSLAATLDAPARFIRSAILGILLALPFAALYEFAILPRIDGYVSLALVLSPAILLFSLMQASERLGGAGLVLAIAFSGGLALQSTYQADFASFVNSNFAEIVGLLVAVAMNLVFRTIDPVWNALRIAKSGCKAVGRLATEERIDPRAWTVQMVDRLALVTSRINGVAKAASARGRLDVLRDLRVGLNIRTIRAAGAELEWASRAALQPVLRAVSCAYAIGLGARSADVTQAVDRGISSIGREVPSRALQDTLAALVGLRLDLALPERRHAIAKTS